LQNVTHAFSLKTHSQNEEMMIRLVEHRN
jgi:hypothetical protein